jgi:hypothetical protein
MGPGVHPRHVNAVINLAALFIVSVTHLIAGARSVTESSKCCCSISSTSLERAPAPGRGARTHRSLRRVRTGRDPGVVPAIRLLAGSVVTGILVNPTSRCESVVPSPGITATCVWDSRNTTRACEIRDRQSAGHRSATLVAIATAKHSPLATRCQPGTIVPVTEHRIG